MRIVVVPDVHGDLDAARRALLAAGVVGEDGAWRAPRGTVVVQLGDQVDSKSRITKRPHVCRMGTKRDMAVVDYFDGLARQADLRGGEVVSLLGNHEVMNCLGMVEYGDVCPRCRAARAGEFRPGGAVARNLSRRPVYAVRGGVLFCHAGFEPETVRGRERFAGLVRRVLAGHADPGDRAALTAAMQTADTPLTTRAYSPDRPSLTAEGAATVLAETGCRVAVVGHNAHPQGVSSYHGDTVWVLDPGMSRALWGAPPVYLDIEADGERVHLRAFVAP
jgi:hypothetical protein